MTLRSVSNALLAARHVLRADAAVVIQGPGNLGTETPCFSGGLRDAINAIATLTGHPVACLRVSQAVPPATGACPTTR